MGLQICTLGHKIQLPIYSGILPSCVYCQDLAKEYSGYDRESKEDFETEDDIPDGDDE